MTTSLGSSQRRFAGALVVTLVGCGSVHDQKPADAAVPPPDAWLKNCAAPALLTKVEEPTAFYRNKCVNGSWYLQAFNGMTTPLAPGQPGNTAQVTPTAITIGSNPLDPSSTYAVHVSGRDQQNSQAGFSYAQLTATLNTLSSAEIGSVDASAYTGVQFYAILATGSTGVRLTVANLYTDPAGGMCTLTSGPTACFDSPGAALKPSTVWTKYNVPFADLVQLKFGNPSPVGTAFPSNAIVVLKWDVGIAPTGPTEPWDLMVDDLTFY